MVLRKLVVLAVSVLLCLSFLASAQQTVNNVNIRAVLAGWPRNADQFAPISQWDTGAVTDMSNLFRGFPTIDEDLSNWDTANVVDMSNIFFGVRNLNVDLSSWNVAKVTKMGSAFETDGSGSVVMGDISGWQVQQVTNFSSMFFNAKDFQVDLSSWRTPAATDMTFMFRGAEMFNSNVNSWGTSQVTSMKGMFQDAENFNSLLLSWNTARVTDMSFMFQGARSFDRSLNGWNTANVEDMSFMFELASSFNGNIANWNTAKVQSMIFMFSDATSFSQNLARWDVSSVRDFQFMFNFANQFTSDLSSWNTASCDKSMSFMFNSCFQFTSDLSGWNVGKVISMERMFFNAANFNSPDLTIWDVSKVESMTRMFSGAINFQGKLCWDLSSIDGADRVDAVFSTINACFDATCVSSDILGNSGSRDECLARDFGPTPAPRPPTSPPTPIPTPNPTPLPTPNPTPGSGLPTVPPVPVPVPICFSGFNMVQVNRSGNIQVIEMRQLRIGDSVQVGPNKYSQVYSFGHYDESSWTSYLAIQVQDHTLEISSNHLVFTQESLLTAQKIAVPASSLAVGDMLVLGSDGRAQAITAIDMVERPGAYAPFTKSGTIVVSNILASNFVTMQPDNNKQGMATIGPYPVMNYHAAGYLSQAPHRFYCTFVVACEKEEEYNAEGRAVSIETPYQATQWWLEQSMCIQGLLLIPLLMILVLLTILETILLQAVSNTMWTATSSIMIGSSVLYYYRQRQGVRQDKMKMA